MFRYTEGGIRERKMQMEKKDTHRGGVMRTSIGTVTEVSITFVKKTSQETKKVVMSEYRTEHETRSVRNTRRKAGRDESIHTRHRLIETGKHTRKVHEGDRGYYWYSAKVFFGFVFESTLLARQGWCADFWFV